MNKSTWFCDRCSLARCPKCHYLNVIEVGVDAHMHDQFRFRCLECDAVNVTTVVMRGAWPSPSFSRFTVAQATPHTSQVPGGQRATESQ